MRSGSSSSLITLPIVALTGARPTWKTSLYLAVQSSIVLAVGFHPHPSPLWIVWTAITAVVMFALAAGKWRTGQALGNPVLVTEGRVTLIDAGLATAVLLGLALNSALGWWWADPLAAYVLVYYGGKEAWQIFRDQRVD